MYSVCNKTAWATYVTKDKNSYKIINPNFQYYKNVETDLAKRKRRKKVETNMQDLARYSPLRAGV